MNTDRLQYAWSSSGPITVVVMPLFVLFQSVYMSRPLKMDSLREDEFFITGDDEYMPGSMNSNTTDESFGTGLSETSLTSLPATGKVTNSLSFFGVVYAGLCRRCYSMGGLFRCSVVCLFATLCIVAKWCKTAYSLYRS